MKNGRKIKIGGNEYILKQLPEVALLFEKMTGESPFKAKATVKTLIISFYCYLKVSNPETFKFEYAEFVDLIDSDCEYFSDFKIFLQEATRMN